MSAVRGSAPRAARAASGACACGRVRLEVEFPSRFVAHCHCENCRRAHGAGFVTWAGFPGERMRVTSGAEHLARHATDTGAERTFCARCGSPLTYSSPRWPGEVHVAVACLAEPLDREPSAHVYADRAPAWCPIRDRLPRFGGASGMEPLAPEPGDREEPT